MDRGRTRGLNYDVLAEADRAGMNIKYGNPGPGLAGIYDRTTRTATIRPRPTWRAERVTISHELVHHEYLDDTTYDYLTHLKRESRCDRIAASRLIDPDELTEVMTFTQDAAEWCRALNVLPWVITTYMKEHFHAEATIRR